MRIVHALEKEKIYKSISHEVGFLLSNQQGSYLSLFNQPTSRYQGWFVPFGNNLYRIIENIKPVNVPTITEIRNNFWNVDRRRDYIYESFVLPDYYHSLIYELSEQTEVEISLDIKETYDSREFGRYYKILDEKDAIVIRYYQENEYEFYLAIKSDDMYYQSIEKWTQRHYDFDKQRNAPPYTRNVFQALRLRGKKFVFSVAQDKEIALKEVNQIYSRSVVIKQLEMEKINKYPKLKKIKDQEIKIAYLCAINSLNSLAVFKDSKPGIFAGLPWFFQFWVRDEAISLNALNTFLPKRAKDIISRLMVSIASDGRIMSTLSPSADGVGWVFKRIEDMITKKQFNDRELERIAIFLEKAINGLLSNHTKDDFAFNQPKETWMDSIDREGARIEIQALRLNMYKLAYKLTKESKYLKLEKKLKEKTRQEFWNKKLLADGLNDYMIRPNIFLVAYVYPELLRKKEWQQCFENSLVKLWLDWGGLATVNRESDLYNDTHTGQMPKSYHNGDSWFFINNMAALVLDNVGRHKFSYQINKILEASTQEILWHGAIGHHTELSSASQFKSEGCWAQAWSAAMYIELVNKILRI